MHYLRHIKIICCLSEIEMCLKAFLFTKFFLHAIWVHVRIEGAWAIQWPTSPILASSKHPTAFRILNAFMGKIFFPLKYD